MHTDLLASLPSLDLLAINGPFNSGSILYTLLIGLVTGAIAKLLMPGKDPGGCIITMIIGIVGAFLAYGIGKVLGLYQTGDTPGLIMSVIGSILLLVIYRFTIGRTGGPGA